MDTETASGKFGFHIRLASAEASNLLVALARDAKVIPKPLERELTAKAERILANLQLAHAVYLVAWREANVIAEDYHRKIEELEERTGR